MQKGDSLYQIAKKYNTTIDELKKINNLSNNNLQINQMLILPQDSKVEVQKYLNYIVQKGDSLYQIANKYNVTLDVNGGNNLEKNGLEVIYDNNYTLPKPEKKWF